MSTVPAAAHNFQHKIYTTVFEYGDKAWLRSGLLDSERADL